MLRHHRHGGARSGWLRSPSAAWAFSKELSSCPAPVDETICANIVFARPNGPLWVEESFQLNPIRGHPELWIIDDFLARGEAFDSHSDH